MPQDQRASLGFANMNIGDNFVCGSTVEDYTSKFRLHINELDLSTYLQFTPGLDEICNSQNKTTQSRYDELYELLDFLKAPEQHADICLHLQEPEQVSMTLSKEVPIMLGYSSWLSPTPDQNRSVVV